MIGLHEFLLLVLVLIWLLFVCLRSVQFVTPAITQFELQRQLKSHDAHMRRLAAYIERLPYLRAFKLLLGGLLISLLAMLAFNVYGSGWGYVALLGGLVVGELLARTTWLRQLLQKLYLKIEPRVFQLTYRISFVLRLFIPRREVIHVPSAFYSKIELAHMIDSDLVVLSDIEKRLLVQGLSYEETTVGDVMTLKSHIESIAASETLGPVVLDRLHKLKLMKFPVIDKDLNHIVGILNLDLIKVTSTAAKHVDGAMDRAVYYLRSDWTLDQAVAASLHTGSSLFIVVNEKRETVGLVTTFDIMRQIFGRKPGSNFTSYDDQSVVAETE